MLIEEEKRATDEELKLVQSAVEKMMRDRRLTVIPTPVPYPTDDMSLFGLDIPNTKGTYMLDETGYVTQATTGYECEET